MSIVDPREHTLPFRNTILLGRNPMQWCKMVWRIETATIHCSRSVQGKASNKSCPHWSFTIWKLCKTGEWFFQVLEVEFSLLAGCLVRTVFGLQSFQSIFQLNLFTQYWSKFCLWLRLYSECFFIDIGIFRDNSVHRKQNNRDACTGLSSQVTVWMFYRKYWSLILAQIVPNSKNNTGIFILWLHLHLKQKNYDFGL